VPSHGNSFARSAWPGTRTSRRYLPSRAAARRGRVDAHRAPRDDHQRPFTTRSTAASHPTSTPHSARTTIPAVSIVIEDVVATGFCAAIMTGTNTAASSAGTAPARRAAGVGHAGSRSSAARRERSRVSRRRRNSCHCRSACAPSAVICATVVAPERPGTGFRELRAFDGRGALPGCDAAFPELMESLESMMVS
jgi:hypothetical protein